jgi:O-antigen/teichoic acid export membrane protein
VLFSAYSRLQSDPRHLTHVFRRSFTAVALTGVPLLVGLMAVAPHFVLVSLGEKWAPMIVPLQLLALASLFRMLSSTTRCLNVAGNAYARQTAVSVVAVALYALFCVVGLRWGIEGVAVGTLLASVLTFFLFAQLALGLLEARWSLFSSVLLPILAGGGAMGAVVYTLSKTLCADYHALNLALLVLAGIAVYGAWFLWIPHEGIQEVRTRVSGDLRTALGMIRPLPSGGEGDIS